MGKRTKRQKVQPGDVFGRLLVQEIKRVPYGNGKTWTRAAAKCLCTCGKYTTVRVEALQVGATHSCGCLQKEQAAKVCLSRIKGDVSGQWDIYTHYQYNATKRKISFALSLTQFTELILQDCYYCGAPPTRTFGKFTCNGVDRLDSNLDYTLDNVVTACGRCNYAKGRMTKEFFLGWIAQIAKKHKL